MRICLKRLNFILLFLRRIFRFKVEKSNEKIRFHSFYQFYACMCMKIILKWKKVAVKLRFGIIGINQKRRILFMQSSM